MTLDPTKDPSPEALEWARELVHDMDWSKDSVKLLACALQYAADNGSVLPWKQSEKLS